MRLPEFEQKAIDIHSHFNHGSPYDDGGPAPLCLHNAGLEEIMAEHRRLGIAYTGMSTFASVLSEKAVCEENEFLQKIADENESIYQWVVVDPRQEDTFAQAEKLLGSKKTLGIKIHPACHGYDIEEYGDSIFSFVNAHKAVLLMHPAKTKKMVSFADRYPDMKLIIAHIGSTAHIDAIRDARHGNIYTDTSGIASSYNNIIEYAVETVGSKKLLFGTDTYSCAFQLGRIVFSGIAKEDKENILWKNARSLFPLCFKEK